MTKKKYNSFGVIDVNYYEEKLAKPNLIDYPLNDQFWTPEEFIDGDGSFNISFKENKKIQFGFHITQDISSMNLLNKVQNFFGCGSTSASWCSSHRLRFQIDGIEKTDRMSVPFIDKYLFHSSKSIHYTIFKKVCQLIYNKPDLSDSDLLNIIELAYNMNKDGKRRKLTKEEYINKYF